MSKRLIVILALLALVASGAIWLHFELLNHAWAHKLNGEWILIAKGWPLLLSAWPVALAGVVIGGAILFFLFGWLFVRGFEEDTKHKLRVMAAKLEHAEKLARNADERAEERLESQWEDLKNQQTVARQALSEYKELRKKILDYCESAKKQVEEAEAKVAEAEKKRDNSAAMAERFRRKLNRLSGASEGS